MPKRQSLLDKAIAQLDDEIEIRQIARGVIVALRDTDVAKPPRPKRAPKLVDAAGRA